MTEVVAIEASDEDVFASIRDEWRSLYRESACSPFLSWEWMATWFEHFGVGKEALIIKVFRGERLIGILPMYRDTASFLGIKTRRLSLMGDGPGGADHLDIICRPDDREEAFSAALAFISKEAIADVISFSNLSSHSPVVGVGKDGSTLFKNSHVSQTVAAVGPQIDISKGWEAVLSVSKRASNFKRRLKQLEKLPDFEFRSITAPAEAIPAFERFLVLHQRRWHEAGGSELSGHPKLVEFQRNAVRRMAEAGHVRFEELWLDGECRSSIYGLDDGVTFYYYSSGYDLNYSSKSVGLVLLGLSVRNAVERGLSLYDFLRGDETYKFEWANRSQEIISVTLRRHSISTWASHGLSSVMTGLTKFGKSALPDSIKVPLANKRRALKRNLQLSGQ